METGRNGKEEEGWTVVRIGRRGPNREGRWRVRGFLCEAGARMDLRDRERVDNMRESRPTAQI